MEKQETCSFASFNFNAKINEAIAAASYTNPTPIQAQSIPSALLGRDILGLAQTGTGKTAAFVLPILEMLLSSNEKNAYKKPVLRSLIVVPTRELAEQVFETIKTLSHGTKLKAITIYGGVSFGTQLRNISHGADIVVACPGRLLDHLQQKTINLKGVEILVLDEADHMFDMGFLPNVRNIVAALKKERQTLMFSATMPEPIKKLAMEILNNPVSIKADKGGPAKTVSHALYPVRQGLKADMVLGLLKKCEDGSVLIFARTKHRAAKLADKLEAAKYSTTCLQGNLSQNRRQEAITGFRKGTYKIMVATDIAARGIDVSSVNHVINYDIPDSVEAYTHRIGRTGRAAQTGTALTLVTSEDESMVRSIERVIGSKIARNKLEDFNYDAQSDKDEGGFGRKRPAPRIRGRAEEPRTAGNNSRRPARRDDRDRGSRGVRSDNRPGYADNRGSRSESRSSFGDNRGAGRSRDGSSQNQRFNERFERGAHKDSNRNTYRSDTPARERSADFSNENIGNNERGHNQSHLTFEDTNRPRGNRSGSRTGGGDRGGYRGNNNAGGNKFRRGSGGGRAGGRGSQGGSASGDTRGGNSERSGGRFSNRNSRPSHNRPSA